MLNNAFNEHFAQQKNILTQIDARIKLIFVIVAIILTIWSKSMLIPLVVGVLSIICLVGIAKIPTYLLLIRLSAPLSIASVVLIIQIFFYGTEPVFELDIAGLHITGFREGIFRGLMIVSKIIGTVSLIMFLTMTTPIHKLLSAGLWLRIPHTFIEITMLTYRYIFVLLQVAHSVKDAQTVRLGYGGWQRGLHSYCELVGAVVIKAYNQTISTHEAMISRGYSESMVVADKKDYLGAIVAMIILILMFAVCVSATCEK